MDFASGEVSATKAWFFLDAGVVALVHNITARGDGNVVTTFDQCLRNGTVHISPAGGGPPQPVPPGNTTATIQAGGYVHHNNKLYLYQPTAAASSLPTSSPPAKLLLRNGPQSGRWSNINSESGPVDLVTKDVFFAAVDHGAPPNLASHETRVDPLRSSVL